MLPSPRQSAACLARSDSSPEHDSLKGSQAIRVNSMSSSLQVHNGITDIALFPYVEILRLAMERREKIIITEGNAIALGLRQSMLTNIRYFKEAKKRFINSRPDIFSNQIYTIKRNTAGALIIQWAGVRERVFGSEPDEIYRQLDGRNITTLILNAIFTLFESKVLWGKVEIHSASDRMIELARAKSEVFDVEIKDSTIRFKTR